MTARTNALGYFTLYNYCTCGSLDSLRDAEGHTTQFFYDNAGRLLNIVYADGYSATNQFDLLGRIPNRIDSAGQSTTNWFNNQGMLYAVSNAFGQLHFAAIDIEDRRRGQTIYFLAPIHMSLVP
ncbi:MAG TPA: hypothetical protein VLT36_10265 [Candidatus Dormibacteraeota bacterium]|nr:hypothetical protein [Candidatus Dormibacteraeota bacterium]